MTELLRIEGLEAGYGRIRILHGISIATTGNKNVGLFGPNGHGKTTLLMLDEPASGLTRPEIETLIALIRRIAGRGITILLIEHVLTVLLALSQRLMVLNQGRVLVQGDPDSVVRDPEVIRAYLGDRKHSG